MVGLRDDLFPKMVGFFETKQSIIMRWVDEAFDALADLYPSKEKFIAYLNSLRDSKDAELLIRISQFYLVAKKYQQESYVKLIMIISAIEKIANREKSFEEFYYWIESQAGKISELLPKTQILGLNEFKQIIRALRDQYFQDFGSRRHVLSFLKEHLIQEDKIKLIRSIEANWTDIVRRYSDRLAYIRKVTSFEELRANSYEVEKSLMPYCYHWKKCYVEGTSCEPSLGCLLTEDSGFQEIILKRVVNDIYRIRSDFIHDAVITPLNEKDAVTLGTIGGKPVSIGITSDDLQKMFERALKHYFDRLVAA